MALRHVPVALRHVPVALRHVPVARRRVPVALRHVPVAHRHVPVARRHVPVALHLQDRGHALQNRHLESHHQGAVDAFHHRLICHRCSYRVSAKTPWQPVAPQQKFRGHRLYRVQRQADLASEDDLVLLARLAHVHLPVAARQDAPPPAAVLPVVAEPTPSALRKHPREPAQRWPTGTFS